MHLTPSDCVTRYSQVLKARKVGQAIRERACEGVDIQIPARTGMQRNRLKVDKCIKSP